MESGRRPDLVYGRRRDDLVRWTNQEPDRFYISQAYESPKRRFRHDEPSGFPFFLVSYTHRLIMEVDLQSLFGLNVT